MDAPVTLYGKITGNQNGVTWTLEPWDFTHANDQTYQFRSSAGYLSKPYTSLSTAILEMRRAMKEAAMKSVGRK